MEFSRNPISAYFYLNLVKNFYPFLKSFKYNYILKMFNFFTYFKSVIKFFVYINLYKQKIYFYYINLYIQNKFFITISKN